ADKHTRINLQAPDVQLQAGVNIGTSVARPVVIAAGRQGTIHAQAPGDVYIANIDGSQTNRGGRLQEHSLQTRQAETDAIQQLNNPTYIQQPEPTGNELDDPLWNSDSQDARTYGAPRIYQDRRGIRLGNP